MAESFNCLTPYDPNLETRRGADEVRDRETVRFAFRNERTVFTGIPVDVRTLARHRFRSTIGHARVAHEFGGALERFRLEQSDRALSFDLSPEF